MKRTLESIVLAGEPLLQQALEAVRANQKAVKDDASAEQVTDSGGCQRSVNFGSKVDFHWSGKNSLRALRGEKCGGASGSHPFK